MKTKDKKKYYKLDSNEMEFLDSMATQITEMNFGENTYASSSEVGKENVIMFQEEAYDFYNERYNESENLYINLILKNKYNILPF